LDSSDLQGWFAQRFVAWDLMEPAQDPRLSSPAALRNRESILDVLRAVLSTTGKVLEIAGGSGEHILHFAANMPQLTWIPSDPSDEARASIAAWLAVDDQPNVLAPLDLDTSNIVWPVDHASAMIAINMVHISPWAATQGLFKGAARILPPLGPLILYGPFDRPGETMAPSNVGFDADLRARNPEWGIRHLDDVAREAGLVGLRLVQTIEMPANNLSLTRPGRFFAM
jgi:SAM-dependent methyltransferase